MKYLSLLIVLFTAGCATTYSLVGYEKVGPVEAEIWRNNKTNKCERRVYMTVMYVTEVNCNDYKTRVTKDVRGYSFPTIGNKTNTKSITRSNSR